MTFLKTSANLFDAWLKALQGPFGQFVDLIKTPDIDPKKIHLAYHSMPQEDRERIHAPSLLKCAIRTDNPAVIEAVVNLVSNGDFNSRVTVLISAPFAYSWSTHYDLLEYALYEGRDNAALYLNRRSDVKSATAELDKTLRQRLGLEEYIPH